MFVEEIVTSGETKPNTNEACSVPTCPDVTNIYMPCCNYSIELSNWICKIWIQVGGGDESKTEKKKELHFFLSDGDETVHWSTTAVCVCVCEKPGPCIERGLPVGTMDATTPTPSPQPTSQRAFIWACTWVLQPCLAKRVCAPEQGGWVPSLNSPGALVANPPTFLRQRPTGFKSKYAVNLLIFATKHNRKKKILLSLKKRQEDISRCRRGVAAR